jgi:glycosyltransferase involved in cell wall biosynthesis
MSSKRTIIVYRDELLGASETFIRAQAESLSRFRPYFVGLRRRAGLSLPEDQVHIISGPGMSGKFQRARFKLLGPSSRLLRMLQKMQPALIHAHFGPDAANAMSLAEALKIPLVVTFHGYDATIADTYLPKLYLRRRDLLKARGARFLCVSEFIRKQVLERGFPAEKLQVHYTGIDTEYFCPNPGVTRSPIVLFVGRLVAKKGCEHAIRAMSIVQGVVPEAKLVVIGDGPLRHRLQTQAHINLRNFEFLGVQGPEAVRQWMNRASVFCTPSIIAESGDAEGFGMVFAEAQAMCLPVVSFATGGIPEAVAHGETGFLVRERDEEGLAASLLVLLLNAQLRTRFSRAGQIRVRGLFDIRKQAVALEEIYENVLVGWNRATVSERASRPQELFPGRGESKPPGLGLPSNEPAIDVFPGSVR